MIESAYNCQNQAVVSVTFRFEAPQTTLRPVKAVEDVHHRLCSLSYPKGWFFDASIVSVILIEVEAEGLCLCNSAQS